MYIYKSVCVYVYMCKCKHDCVNLCMDVYLSTSTFYSIYVSQIAY